MPGLGSSRPWAGFWEGEVSGEWQIWVVAGAVLAAVGYLLWKMFGKGGGKGCGRCS